MNTTPNGAHALLITTGGEVLLVAKGQEYTFDPRNAGKVAMFGGGIEDGETIMEALYRELREELEFDVTGHPIHPLGTYEKTQAQDGMQCSVHVFTVRDVNPAILRLHEGAHEETGEPTPPDHNKNIIRGTVESLLARTDLTRITRTALEAYMLTRNGDMPQQSDTHMHTQIPQGAAGILITSHNTILLQRKTDDYPSVNAGKLTLFGGDMDPGETELDTLTRELQEELELTLTADHRVTKLCRIDEPIEDTADIKHSHVYLVHGVDPNHLVLHEGAGIEERTVEAHLARTDLSHLTRKALEEYVLTRCARKKSENAEMVRQLEQSLVYPTKTSGTQFLVCPIGEIGAGKTTVLRQLSERLSLLRISGDELRKVFREHDKSFDDLYDCAEGELWKCACAGYNIAVDGDCSSTRMQHTIRALQESLKLQVFWVHVNPPEEFILNKLRTYTHTWLFRDGEHAVENYLRRKDTREHPDVPFVYTFDPSRDDLATQINEAINRIEQILHTEH